MPSVSKLNNVKRVQDDHQFSSVVFCYIEVQKKLKAHYSLLTTQKRLEDGERQPSSSKIHRSLLTAQTKNATMLILGRYKKVFEKKTVYLHKFNI